MPTIRGSLQLRRTEMGLACWDKAGQLRCSFVPGGWFALNAGVRTKPNVHARRSGVQHDSVQGCPQGCPMSVLLCAGPVIFGSSSTHTPQTRTNPSDTFVSDSAVSLEFQLPPGAYFLHLTHLNRFPPEAFSHYPQAQFSQLLDLHSTNNAMSDSLTTLVPPAAIPGGAYTPVLEYQTRLTELHGDLGVASSPLSCSLHKVDLLRGEFGAGLGLINPDGTKSRSRLVEYDALSYTWGDGGNTHHLQCHGADLSITKNLCQALLELRYSGSTPRWLWVDAICINQEDDNDKAIQIRNMLFIYKQASKVVAWLGADLVHAQVLPDLATIGGKRSVGQHSRLAIPTAPEPRPLPHTLDTISQALTEVYRHPYFQRIWVQQEVFAASVLRVRCAGVEFDWSGILAEPMALVDNFVLPKYGELAFLEKEQAKQFCKKHGITWTLMSYILAQGPDGQGYADGLRDGIRRTLENKKKRKVAQRTIEDQHVIDQLQLISALTRLQQKHTGCFQQIRDSAMDERPIELIDALLLTGGLQAKMAHDRVYGLLSMTNFPSRVMTLQEWLRNPPTSPLVMPVDVTLDGHTVQILVTKILLMEGGIVLLEKFKIMAEGTDDDSEALVSPPEATSSATALPSWVVDWQLASRFFDREIADKSPNTAYGLHLMHGLQGLHDAWNTIIPERYEIDRRKGKRRGRQSRPLENLSAQEW
ncbi:heterokaryon incompatibility protein-domain-containing protein [Microdochium trichocladiopsis]|uniref:Heterokaryon incompatibility protein-domain-containing protein n=1 Tax=Microdochium trichocladiopsis TaxID=1682393 RepID=A0A9P8XZE9_9PEZI|nr:heterokaryon incompatibility protein-domain-containing protein [Microdochium trichocladiopsis]KAH7021368.1 heterokaryon incompatibility protein-domain-containing protein [Microdochium trichocladiopsis]